MSESKKKVRDMSFVVHEHVPETTMTRVSSCMYVMKSVSDVVLKYMMLGSNTDRVPAEYRQIRKTVHIVSVVFTFTWSFTNLIKTP